MDTDIQNEPINETQQESLPQEPLPQDTLPQERQPHEPIEGELTLPPKKPSKRNKHLLDETLIRSSITSLFEQMRQATAEDEILSSQGKLGALISALQTSFTSNNRKQIAKRKLRAYFS